MWTANWSMLQTLLVLEDNSIEIHKMFLWLAVLFDITPCPGLTMETAVMASLSISARQLHCNPRIYLCSSPKFISCHRVLSRIFQFLHQCWCHPNLTHEHRLAQIYRLQRLIQPLTLFLLWGGGQSRLFATQSSLQTQDIQARICFSTNSSYLQVTANVTASAAETFIHAFVISEL